MVWADTVESILLLYAYVCISYFVYPTPGGGQQIMNCDELGHRWDILWRLLYTYTLTLDIHFVRYDDVVSTLFWCFAQAQTQIDTHSQIHTVHVHVQTHNNIQINCVYRTFGALICLLFACTVFSVLTLTYLHFEHSNLILSIFGTLECSDRIIVSSHITIMTLFLFLFVNVRVRVPLSCHTRTLDTLDCLYFDLNMFCMF